MKAAPNNNFFVWLLTNRIYILLPKLLFWHFFKFRDKNLVEVFTVCQNCTDFIKIMNDNTMILSRLLLIFFLLRRTVGLKCCWKKGSFMIWRLLKNALSLLIDRKVFVCWEEFMSRIKNIRLALMLTFLLLLNFLLRSNLFCSKITFRVLNVLRDHTVYWGSSLLFEGW